MTVGTALRVGCIALATILACALPARANFVVQPSLPPSKLGDPIEVRIDVAPPLTSLDTKIIFGDGLDLRAIRGQAGTSEIISRQGFGQGNALRARGISLPAYTAITLIFDTGVGDTTFAMNVISTDINDETSQDILGGPAIVPLPAAAPLLLTGLGGLAWLWRRSHRASRA